MNATVKKIIIVLLITNLGSLLTGIGLGLQMAEAHKDSKAAP